MKKLWNFVLHKEQDVEEQETTTNDKGEEVVTKKKVKQLVPHNYFIAKPTRVLSDDASLYYSVCLSEAIRAGLLTIAQIEKRYSNDDGVFSVKEKKAYQELYEKLLKNMEEFQKSALVTEDKRTEEEKEKHGNLVKEIAGIQTKIQDYENFKSSVFDHTAEVYARNKTVTWWLLHLSYRDSNPPTSFFGNGTVEDRLKEYDNITEDEDPFTRSIIEKFLFGISVWSLGKANKQEDFVELDKVMNQLKKDNDAVSNSDVPKESVSV